MHDTQLQSESDGPTIPRTHTNTLTSAPARCVFTDITTGRKAVVFYEPNTHRAPLQNMSFCTYLLK